MRFRRAVAVATVLAGALAACADGESSSSGADAKPSSVAAEDGGSGTTGGAPEASTAGADGSWPPSTPTSSVAPTTTVPPGPIGVPGVDDTNAFCAAWARYSGTLQAVGVAAAFGDLGSVEMARLEVSAAGALAAAAAGIGSEWPAALVAERSVVLTDVVGPFERRAAKALAALREAGATEEDIARLAEAWTVMLRNRDPENPVPTVTLPADLVGLVDAATEKFDRTVTPFVDDPSLMSVGADTPRTDAYLAAQCPDLASSGVGDAL